MSYTTIKDALINLLGTVSLAESTEAFDFENASAREYNNRFILLAISGENDEDISESLSDRIFDIQEWLVQVAFKKSANNDISSRDEMLRKKDDLIDLFDNPSNNGFTRLLKYKSWGVEDVGEYFLLTIRLKIVDTIIYS